MLVVDLSLLGTDSLALRPLVLSILTHEAQAAVHLIEVLRREDKHQTVLHRSVARHIAHRLNVFLLSVTQLLLQGLQLRVENTDVSFDMMNVLLNALDIVLTLIDLPVDDHQVLQALSDVGFVFLQSRLLLPYLLLYGSALAL